MIYIYIYIYILGFKYIKSELLVFIKYVNGMIEISIILTRGLEFEKRNYTSMLYNRVLLPL